MSCVAADLAVPIDQTATEPKTTQEDDDPPPDAA
jgi:hypothetical protein